MKDTKKTAPKKDTRTRAADLIAKKSAGHATPAPSGEALAELRKLCEYNDGAPSARDRVSMDQAIAMLREYGWTGQGRSALNTVCVTLLGRSSYGVP